MNVNNNSNTTFDFKNITQPKNYRSIPIGAVIAAAAENNISKGDTNNNNIYRSVAMETSTTFDPSNLPVYRNIEIPTQNKLLIKPDLSSFRKESTSYYDSSYAKEIPDIYQDSSACDITTPPQMPSQPFHLEKFSHTYTKMKPDKIIDFVNKSLKSENSDFEFNSSKFKWKINNYNMNKVVKIRIQVYSTISDIFAIEFQRRKGCQMSFYSFFRKLKAKWIKNGFICCKLGYQKSASSANCPPHRSYKVIYRGSSCNLANSQTDSLRSLLEMADSNYLDIQIEAIREIATLSEATENKRAIVEVGMLPTLISLVKSQNNDIHRCSAVALANVAEGDSWTKQKLVDAGVLESLMNLMQINCKNFEHLESQRACARCLSNLCKVVNIDSKNSAIFYRAKSILREVHTNCTDSRLKKQCVFGSSVSNDVSVC